MRVKIEDIKKVIRERYRMSAAVLDGAKRTIRVARPRQIGMYLARKLTDRSYPDISRRFGNRDHTTAIHAVRRIEFLMALYPGFQEEIESVEIAIKLEAESRKDIAYVPGTPLVWHPSDIRSLKELAE